jgi:ubiquitin-protein ligase
MIAIPENTPYAGGLFHFVLSFPHNYPNKPPSARVLSPIPHPHVHGDLVCLDLLRYRQSLSVCE